MDYTNLAANIIQNVGGKTNINDVWHCATRLRFKLADESKANTNTIESLDGVITVVQSAGQYQIVIGNAVEDVFDTLSSQLNLSNNIKPVDTKAKRQNPINALMEFVSAVFTPFLGALAGAGILKGLLTLATTMNWLSANSGAYKLWYAASDAVFYFLPLFLAFTAAQKLKVNKFIAVSLAGAMIYPTLATTASKGISLSFFGLPIMPVTYTASVFPILLIVWGLSYVEPLLNRIFPESMRNVLTPLLLLIVMLPVSMIIIGPVGSSISNILAAMLAALYNFSPMFAGAILGALHQTIVIFGVHWALITLMINNVANQGYDQWLPIICAAVLSQAGASLGVFLKTKDPKMKTLAGSAFITGLFGITEPAIYGVTLKLKRPFYCAMVASGIGGAVIGANQVHASTFTFPSLLAIPTYLGQGFTAEIIGLLIAFFGAVILTYLFGIKPTTDSDSKAEKLITENEVDIKQPIAGKIISMETVNDPVFSGGAMGTGIAIEPTEGQLKSPVNGTVSAVFPTGHAIGITSDDGVELLLHIGINTVQLNGKFFKTLVTQSSKVSIGTDLIEFDLDSIKKAGYDTTVMMVVTNSNQFNDISTKIDNPQQQNLIHIRMKANDSDGTVLNSSLDTQSN
ncbi:beta-glucoside-specific PTS transporter subunit IIABC [Companilactobacillus huachuanensis]|uniref:Beta-glucoside-specific PTS transporter subunit IIABC n=1 Tax=Companilactobacillus huachuanensis TaxID=2559914 RepID=A0ABW1RQQ1_9LACO|nr:beta-glucoside-specific PTS transporter subunit IIABC [Companilactobacillus huachuanensis]